MGGTESKTIEELPPPDVLLDTESSEEENIEIINILKNANPESTDDDQENDETDVSHNKISASHPPKEDSSNMYSDITKYSQSFWNFVSSEPIESESTRNGTNTVSNKEHVDKLLNSSSEGFDLFGLSRSLTAQMDSLVKGLAGSTTERPPSVGLFDQFPEGPSGISRGKVVAPTSLTLNLKAEYLKSIQDETPQQITEVKLSESFTEGSGTLFSLTELITGVSSDILEPEIDNLVANPQRTIIWQSDSSLLVRFGSSRQVPIIVIDAEGTPSEEDFLSICALFQEYRTKPCFELRVPSQDSLTDNKILVQALRVWFEVINLSLFVSLKEDLVDLYDEDLLYVLPVPVFEEHLLFQWDFVHRFANVSGSIKDTEDGTISFFRCIYEHLTIFVDSDAVFIYIRDLLQFIQKSGILNPDVHHEQSSSANTLFGGGIIIVLRYLNHHLPEDKHRLLVRADATSGVFANGLIGSPNSGGNSSGGKLRCYYEEFLPQDDSRPLLQPLGQICLHSNGQFFYCSYKCEAVVQSRQELMVNSAKVNWKELLSGFYY